MTRASSTAAWRSVTNLMRGTCIEIATIPLAGTRRLDDRRRRLRHEVLVGEPVSGGLQEPLGVRQLLLEARALGLGRAPARLTRTDRGLGGTCDHRQGCRTGLGLQ